MATKQTDQSTRLHAKRYKFENNRRIRSKFPSANLQVTCAPASCSLAPQNPSQLYNNGARSSTNTVDVYASIWPQTTRFNTTHEYSRLATASARQSSTCYGRDGTIASTSIDTERGSAALVLTRKQKVIARPSVNFQQGGPGFQVRQILLTFAVSAAVKLFVQPLV